MRIGIDARLWGESGVGRYIRNLVKYLSKLDVGNEYVLFLREEEYENSKFQIPCLAGRQANSKFKKVLANIRWHTLKEQFLLPKILERENLDLVHFPYFSVPIFYNRPFVVTIHDLTIIHFPTGRASTLPYPVYFLKHLGYRIVLSQAIKKAKKVIVPSKATKKEVREHFKVPEEKIAVTYEGSSLDNQGKRKVRPPKNFTLNPKQYFLYVGNAYPHKNLERLLEAFLKLKIKNEKLKTRAENLKLKNLKLVLVGREDYFYTRLKKRVEEMGLSNQVVFYGETNDQELSWLYQNAIALVFPSLMEGFGLPALEAMACGCLVLSSDTSALREVCKRAAIYFNSLDVKEMAQKMADVSRNYNTISYYRGKKELGLRRAEMFSWQKMAKETLRIYENCFV